MQQITGWVAGGLIVALVIGCSRAPDPSPPPAPTPLDVPAVADRWADLTWTQTDIKRGPGGNVRLVAAASDGGQILAIGADEEAALDTFFVTSADGTEWVQPEFGLVGVELVDVTSTIGGLVAAGANDIGANGEPRGAVFTSVDGRAWLPVEDSSPFFDAHMLSVAAGPGGLIATGASAEGEPLIWMSGDGKTWRRTTTEEFGLPRAMVESISVGPNGWLAAGRPLEGSVAISSTDGASWTASPLSASSRELTPIATKAFDGGRARLVLGMEVQECGFLWWEGDCAGGAAAWWSAARGSWVPLRVAGTPLAEWPVVTGTEDGFVAASGHGVYASVDGQVWSRLTALDPEAGISPSDIVVTEERIVVVGSRTEATGRMLGWIAVGAP